MEKFYHEYITDTVIKESELYNYKQDEYNFIGFYETIQDAINDSVFDLK